MLRTCFFAKEGDKFIDGKNYNMTKDNCVTGFNVRDKIVAIYNLIENAFAVPAQMLLAIRSF